MYAFYNGVALEFLEAAWNDHVSISDVVIYMMGPSHRFLN